MSCPTIAIAGEVKAVPPAMLHGLAPETLSPQTDTLLTFLYAFLPEPPVSTSASLCCAAAADSTDRVSRLPEVLLRPVLSRLPAKDGARTTVLSSRWRGLWRSAPLVLVDTHLLSGGDAGLRPARAGASSRGFTDAVSAALEAHPGPFPFVSLTCSFMDGADRRLIARWFQLLATKGVGDLVFVNRPFPVPGLHLPSSLFSCASIRRLCIGAWVFPDTAALPRGAAFPNLRHLPSAAPLWRTRTWSSCSPLRCAQFCLSILEEVSVVDGPSLERLFLWRNWSERLRVSKMSTAVKIAHAPKLLVLGYLEPGVHILQIGNTIIKAGTKASTRTTVSSVLMLALHLHFEVRSEVKMLPSFLRCFPSIETLIVESEETLEPTTSNPSPKFWQGTGPIECVKSHLKILCFREVRGNHKEFGFLTFIAENARKLEVMSIVIKNGLTYTERAAVAAELRDLSSANWANRDCRLLFRISSLPIGGSPWSLKAGSDLSCEDPFCCL
uniref:Uncharacterized protein n=1 Tax=Avena sativa TaxID=4498 RepID=A0ACD5Z7P8_AVESA